MAHIRSLFILNPVGEVIIEKHWRGLTSRQVVDHFITERAKYNDTKDVPPVMAHPRFSLVHVQHNSMFLLGVVEQEASSLMVIDFLLRVIEVLRAYFQELSQESLQEHFTTVYEVLEEMIDNGMPFLTELNSLQDMVNPRGLGQMVRSGLDKLPSDLAIGGQMGAGVNAALPGAASGSSVPWRRQGVRYANNEMYIDIVEALQVIVDTNQMMISSEVKGTILCNSRLSGMPDLTLSFVNSRVLDDVSLHPCVRLHRWENGRVISFIPPDGEFQLLTYRSTGHIELPLYVKPQISWASGASRISVMVGQKGSMTRPVENVEIKIPLPKAVTGCTLNAPAGSWNFDDNTRTITWVMSKLPAQSPILQGSLQMNNSLPLPDSKPILTCDFKVIGTSATGIKVDSLQMTAESYKPWKGVRIITRGGHGGVTTVAVSGPGSGCFQIRA